MNAQGGPSEARRAKEGASADCAEEMKDTTGVGLWRLHASRRKGDEMNKAGIKYLVEPMGIEPTTSRVRFDSQ